MDNGIGIVEPHPEYILAVFQHMPTEQEYEGIGIGVAIARKSSSATAGENSHKEQRGSLKTFGHCLAVITVRD